MIRLAITPGEPSGIGPDLIVQLAQEAITNDLVRIVIVDPDLLLARARVLGLPLRVRLFTGLENYVGECGEITVLPVSTGAPVQPGRLEPANAAYVLETLTRAVEGCLAGQFDGLVTGPVHKGIINKAGIPFTGHTEFLANYCKIPRPVMMLVADTLRVALATTHLPLSAVSQNITQASLEEVLRILDHDLRWHFGIKRPRILVCGLNPHAGEGGYLGREEIDIIEPVLECLREDGLDLVGPLPADTLFTPRYLQIADAVLAMYHDQGLPVLKYAGFGHAVNVTLGLPIVRTSVDHGTALDLAGTGQADHNSLKQALLLAENLARRTPFS